MTKETALRILVVDDDESIRLGYSQLFTMYGYEVVVAPDGLMGFHAFETSHFDLVITDILMPGEDGLTMIKQIRGQNLKIKIIAISGGGKSHNPGFLDIAKSFGADLTLEKPVSTVDLIKTVEDLLN